MGENILLISEDKSNLESLFSNVSVLRRGEMAGIIPLANVKRAVSDDIRLVLINEKEYFRNEIFKTVEMITRISPETLIIVIQSKNDDIFAGKCYEKGVYDFIHFDSSPVEYNIRILNSLKYLTLKEKFKIISLFLNNTASINAKTGLFTHKSLKENFDYICENPMFKTGSYIVLSIDSAVKTKVSMNRLGLNLKKYLRQTDIIAQGSGKYYILLPKTSLQGAKTVIEKISDFMGEDIKIHAGISVLGIRSFDELEKDANDSLKSAIVNDELYVSLGENMNIDENLVDTPKADKHFKLFQKVFNKKLTELIEPLFFRTEKEFQAKSDDILISQYANKVECVFSIKSGKKQSEFVMRYDGFAKFNFKIIHQGLDTCENSQGEIPLNELNEKLLTKYLHLLYSEFNK